MCLNKAPQMPATTAPPPAPTPEDPSVVAARDALRRRLANASSRSTQILSGEAGVNVPTAGKTLLGT